MDLKIPNIVKPIELKEYAVEFGDATIWVWVNPRRELRLQLQDEILQQKADEDVIWQWFAEIWSQGPDDTHFTPEEVKQLAENCIENSPPLWSWLITKTFGLIFEHLQAKKKPSN